jgi:hypothetical protein
MSERIWIDPRLRWIATGGLVFLGALQVSKWTDFPVFLAGTLLVVLVLLILGMGRFLADRRKVTKSFDGLVIGKTGARQFALPFFESRHTLITGITGSGKSTLIMRLIQETLKKGASFVYFDFKGEQSDHDRLLQIANGKELLVFDLADLGRCVSCNFLTLFSGIAETVGIVADLLFEEDTPTYFKLEGSRFLRYALELLDGAGERRSFVRLEVLFQDDRYRSELIARYKKNKAVSTLCLSYFENEFDSLKSSARSERFGGMMAGISAFNEGEFRRIFSPEVETEGVRRLLSGEVSGVIRLPGEVFGDFSEKIMHAFLRVFPNLVAERRAQKDPKPVAVFLDEACSYLRHDLVDFTKKAGSAKIKLFVTRMCDADFQAVSPSMLGQMLSLFETFICMQTSCPDTRETMARLSMTREEVKMTKKLAVTGETGEGSARDVQKFVFHPTTFGRLARGQAIVISPSFQIFKKIQVLQAELQAEVSA